MPKTDRITSFSAKSVKSGLPTWNVVYLCADVMRKEILNGRRGEIRTDGCSAVIISVSGC